MKREWMLFFGLLLSIMLVAPITILVIKKYKEMPIKWESLYWIAVGFALFASVYLIVLSLPNFNAIPEQQAQAEVGYKQEILAVGGRIAVYYRVVTFESSDGSSIRLDVKSRELFNSIREGDKGILTYKEKEARKGFLNYFFHDFSNKLFISFEPDR